MSPINILVALVIIAAIARAVKKVMHKKSGCGCGCQSCHSTCSVNEKKRLYVKYWGDSLTRVSFFM